MQSKTTPLSSKGTQVAERILQLYGFDVVRILAPQKGYRNHSFAAILADKSMVNLMVYKQEPGILDVIQRADAVSNYIAERGIPARHTLGRSIIALKSKASVRYANVYDYLPGETIPWEAYTQGHIKALGAMMASMHAILEACPQKGLPDAEDVYTHTVEKMWRYFDEPGVRVAMRDKLGLRYIPTHITRYQELLNACSALPGRQVLHMDFVRGNILFDGETSAGLPHISGVLDMEKAAVGVPLIDIARTLAFLLVDCKYKTSDKVVKYFLESGYIKRGGIGLKKITVKLGTERHDLLALLMDMFLLHDLYKFLRHNPYESLAHNEHYVRTRDILLSRGVIDVV